MQGILVIPQQCTSRGVCCHVRRVVLFGQITNINTVYFQSNTQFWSYDYNQIPKNTLYGKAQKQFSNQKYVYLELFLGL